MPALDNYLFFDGRCAEAMRFYQSVLGGQLETLLTYADSPEPAQCPDGTPMDANTAASRIMHASLLLEGERRLMASDCPPGQPVPAMAGFAVSLFYEQPQEAQRAFDALATGGQVTMPWQETFWAVRFGMLTDRFGTPWMVSGGCKTQ